MTTEEMRALDRGVFERFFGFRLTRIPSLQGGEICQGVTADGRMTRYILSNLQPFTDEEAMGRLCPEYTCEAISAWPVVEELRGRGWTVEMTLPSRSRGALSCVRLIHHLGLKSEIFEWHNNLGVAICRAALRTLEEEL